MNAIFVTTALTVTATTSINTTINCIYLHKAPNVVVALVEYTPSFIDIAENPRRQYHPVSITNKFVYKQEL